MFCICIQIIQCRWQSGKQQEDWRINQTKLAMLKLGDSYMEVYILSNFMLQIFHNKKFKNYI